MNEMEKLQNVKAVMIAKVKNESDIIESFVRYHVNIFEKIVIIDNGSTDHTFAILTKLKSEGLNIEIINEGFSKFDSFRLANKYAYMIAKQEKPDFLVLMDADEFLIAENGENPKNVLKRLSKDRVYYVKWRTYLYHEVKESSYFIPDNFEYYRDAEKEEFTKLIIPAELMLEKEIIIGEGNHDFKCINQVGTEALDTLKFAHYPVRSREQFEKQTLLNAINIISIAEYKKHTSQHWKKSYQNIKSGKIELEDESVHYSLYDSETHFFKGKINTAFCQDLEIRYHDISQEGILNCIYQFSELLALRYKKLSLENEDIDRREKIIIYGIGQECQNRISQISKEQYQIVAFVDSDPMCVFSTFMDKIVITPDKIRFFKWDRIVIASSKYYEEIKQRLEEEYGKEIDKSIITIESLIVKSYETEN